MPVAETPAGPAFVSLPMPGFLVPSSPGVSHTTYLMADLSLDLAPEAAERLGRETARFRDVVFRTLKKTVDASKGTEITEENLQKDLIDALNDALKDRAVLRVVFTQFSMG
jgi:flagellar basal body-associated protein FliL